MTRDQDLAAPPGDEQDPEIKALEEELRKAQDELTATRDERERQGRALQLKDDIESARQKKAEEVAVSEAERTYGPLGAKVPKLARVDVAGVGMFLVRCPDPIKIKKFYERVQQADESMTLDQTFEVARPFIVYPPKERADQLYAERPLIAEPLAQACLRLGGLKLNKAAGK
jgi:hypothetical protein